MGAQKEGEMEHHLFLGKGVEKRLLGAEKGSYCKGGKVAQVSTSGKRRSR